MKLAPKFNVQKHIDAVGLDVFDRAVGKAMLRLKQDGRLLSATKLRQKLSEEMAIIATGGPRRPFSLEKYQASFGQATQEMQDIVDHYINTTESEITC
jgi:hypothetical protein